MFIQYQFLSSLLYVIVTLLTKRQSDMSWASKTLLFCLFYSQSSLGIICSTFVNKQKPPLNVNFSVAPNNRKSTDKNKNGPSYLNVEFTITVDLRKQNQHLTGGQMFLGKISPDNPRLNYFFLSFCTNSMKTNNELLTISDVPTLGLTTFFEGFPSLTNNRD